MQQKLDRFIKQRVEKQEDSKKSTSNVNTHSNDLSAHKIDKVIDVMTKSGQYICSGKKQRKDSLKSLQKQEIIQKIAQTLTSNQKKTLSLEKKKEQLQGSNLLASFPQKNVQANNPADNQKKVTAQEIISKSVQNADDSSHTINLSDSITNLQVLKPATVTCPQYILIGPFNILQANDLENKLQDLMNQCTKKRVLDFIKERNQISGQYKNLSNLQKIHDDEFWCITMQKIIGLILKKQELFNGCVKTLPYIGELETLTLNRLQIFLLVASMFLSIIPSQSYITQTSFIYLMTIHQTDQKSKHKPLIRLQKLKCVVNYLKIMSQNEQIYYEKVIFDRTVSYDKEYLRSDKQFGLRDVEVTQGKIQEGFGHGAMIDFANSAVGGGFLGNGSAQEEIMFSIFPELTVLKLLCQQLREQEAIVIRGARRFNSYEGYAHNFKFAGSYQGGTQLEKSVIIAVDAMDFTKGLLKKSSQYSRKFILREIHKFFVGIDRACCSAFGWQPQKVYTGRWGCGVYGADEYLKFCIQWLICSYCGVDMIFMAGDADTKKQLRLLVRNLKDRTVSDLFYLIQSYGKEGKFSEKGLLNYFKNYS